MNFVKDNMTQTNSVNVITRSGCSGLSGSCETSDDTKRAAAALDKQNNGHCNKT